MCDCKTEALFHFLNTCLYSDMLDFMAEQPYDSIPNFTAADALRLTGVGRNEFIDIMNKCRSKVFLDMIFGSYTVRCSCNLVNIHMFQIVDHVN